MRFSGIRRHAIAGSRTASPPNARGANEYRAFDRFPIGRLFSTDAASTLIVFTSIYATEESGFPGFETQLVLLAGTRESGGRSPCYSCSQRSDRPPASRTNR